MRSCLKRITPTLPSVWRPPQPQEGRVCLEPSSLALRSDAAPLLPHINHIERVNGRVVAEVGAHSTDLTSGSVARHTDTLGALFVRRAAMLTARVKDFNITALLLPFIITILLIWSPLSSPYRLPRRTECARNTCRRTRWPHIWTLHRKRFLPLNWNSCVPNLNY